MICRKDHNSKIKIPEKLLKSEDGVLKELTVSVRIETLITPRIYDRRILKCDLLHL